MEKHINEFYDFIYGINNKFKRPPANYTTKLFLTDLLKNKKIGNLQISQVLRKANKYDKIEYAKFYDYFYKQPIHNVNIVGLLAKVLTEDDLYKSYRNIFDELIKQFAELEFLNAFDDEIKVFLSKINMSDLKLGNYNSVIKSLLDIPELKDSKLYKDKKFETFPHINILDNILLIDIMNTFNKMKNKEVKTFEKNIGIEFNLKFIQDEIDFFHEYLKKYESKNTTPLAILLDLYEQIRTVRYKNIFDNFGNLGEQ